MAYPNPLAEKCPACGYQTLLLRERQTVSPATTTLSGWGWVFKDCKNCLREDKKRYTIPKIIPSSSSDNSSSSSFSSSSSSSSSSDSSSGGDSGGGGAGSSW